MLIVPPVAGLRINNRWELINGSRRRERVSSFRKFLFSAFAAFFAVLIMNGLPRWYHPMFNWERFSRATNDGFFLVIEARDARFTELEVREILEQTGGQHVTLIHED